MKRSLYKTVEAAVLLALLICLQALGALIPVQLTKQLITGTLVNCVLAVTVLLSGMGSGIALALCSPVCAFLLGIAPNLITVVPIMAGNCCYVALLGSCKSAPLLRQGIGLAAASLAKFAVLYLLVVQLICGMASGALLGKKLGDTVLLAPPMLKLLPVMFSWPQLVTALVGGGLALAILPVLRKALHR